MVKKSDSNTRLFIVLGIVGVIIILGVVFGRSYVERFTSEKKLVYFFMDECPHCQNFDSEWNKLKEILKTDSKYSGIKVEKINLNSMEGKEYKDVNSAPTIMLLPSKKTYEGERDAYLILEWTTKY